jgi:two-component system, OmpR family, alkaline phosphatase synthesis response regulator PhoP
MSSAPFPVSTGRVLLVEDEKSIRELVAQQLRRVGYDCEAVADGREGLALSLSRPFDVVVLDLMLPNVDGMTICRTIRTQGVNQHVPILMLTAKRAESDKVLGFESGADDYVTKPFGVLELTARVAALTRRAQRPAVAPAVPARRQLSVHGVDLDPVKHTIRVRDREVSLTPHEFELLYQLASQPGVMLTRQQLLNAVWNDQAFVTERSIDTLVRHLRCKVEEDSAVPRLILTVWGYGYKFADA